MSLANSRPDLDTRSASFRREPRADVLRVMAVLGVFVVNGLGYLTAPGYPIPMGAPAPGDSSFSLVVYGILFFLFQGKAWPLLCLLFGYSLQSIANQLSARGVPPRAALRSRYWKLLLLGMAHGLLIYFGDVLTAYAISGLIVARWATIVGLKRLKVSRLLHIWKWWLAFSVISTIVSGLAALGMPPEGALPAYSTVSSWAEFFKLTASHYSYVVIASVTLYLPLYVWLSISGMLLCRLRLLSNRPFARRFWRRHFGLFQLLCSSALCAFWAGYAVERFTCEGGMNQLSAIAMLSVPSGIWWLACCLACTMRQANQGLAPIALWLAPAGRYTLAMYLGLSIFLMLAVSPVFGGWLAPLFKNTGVGFLTLLAAWLFAVWLARAAARNKAKDPLSKWLGSSHKIGT